MSQIRWLGLTLALLWIIAALVFGVGVARAYDCGIDAPDVCGTLP